ncbi:CHAP domain-containing protein [Rhodococcus sp. IEGM 1374]|uniref:CHAP domain-containing protein n=1 Tax=Rhodococcus sp. IEGM 1374 TaxID=3082221 RepID=UPI002954874F|nr:CHAP domain-containing protein [Rhodococcus sp. IEGM 1374]MDV7990488.1 CHAP domain-containing protein [Rhodococcus sp. IEGM 1374]
MTQDKGVAWAVERIGQRIDYDGAYGSQCMDLVVAMCVEGFGWRPYGNAIRLTDQAVPVGWQRVRKTASFIPAPGDIAIWGLNEYATYGHTGIIESANEQTFVSIDQNWFNPSLAVGSPAARVQHNYYGFWGVLRPPYKTKGGHKLMDAADLDAAFQHGPFQRSRGKNEADEWIGRSVFDFLRFAEQQGEVVERKNREAAAQRRLMELEKQVLDKNAAAINMDAVLEFLANLKK